MIYIVAGNTEEAFHYAREKEWLPNEFRVVGDIYRLYGIREGTIYMVGTFWDRKDAKDILDTVKRLELVSNRITVKTDYWSS